MSAEGINDWHTFLRTGDVDILERMLADDCVFESPVMHTPSLGKAKTREYMIAAQKLVGSPDLEFVQEFDMGDRAVVEFSVDLNGVTINGVDLIKWNEQGQVTHFKVMVRPLKAMQAMSDAMMAMMQRERSAK